MWTEPWNNELDEPNGLVLCKAGKCSDNELFLCMKTKTECKPGPFHSYGELSHKMSVSDVLVFWSSTIALQTANSTLHFSDYFWHHNILVRIKNQSSDSWSLIMTFSPDEVIWCVHV